MRSPCSSSSVRVRLGLFGPCVPPLQNPVPAPSSALPGPRRAEPPVPASSRQQVPGWGPPRALVTWTVGRQDSGGRARPSTLAVLVYMRAPGAGPQPASPLQAGPAPVFLLGRAVRPCLFLVTTFHSPPNSAAPYRHLWASPSQGLPPTGSSTHTWAWREPEIEALLCATGAGAVVWKAPLLPQGLGNPGLIVGSKGSQPVPDTAAIACRRSLLASPLPSLPRASPPFLDLHRLRRAPRQPTPRSGSLVSPYTSSLPCTP